MTTIKRGLGNIWRSAKPSEEESVALRKTGSFFSRNLMSVLRTVKGAFVEKKKE